jgi:hypothetical protein
VTSVSHQTPRRRRTTPLPTKKENQARTKPTIPVYLPCPTCPLTQKTNISSEDERSIANRLAAAEPQNEGDSGKATQEDKLAQEDPTAPARLHGNEPSKGAKIDAEIQAEEEAELAKKDAAKKQSKKH